MCYPNSQKHVKTILELSISIFEGTIELGRRERCGASANQITLQKAEKSIQF